MEKKPIILSLISPYSDAFQLSIDHLPPQLQLLYNQYLEHDYIQLLGLAAEYISSLGSATVSQQENLEELTRVQSKSKDWYKYRAGRITASRFYQITHTNPHMPALSLIHSVCYPQTNQFSSKATRYGCAHEKDAIEAYKLQITSHDEVEVFPSGFVVSLQKPFIGASPDAFVECKCCGQGVLEVKCPLCAEHSSLRSASIAVPQFCLIEGDDHSLQLNHDHPYYYQCQLQLYVTERMFCDFVV